MVKPRRSTIEQLRLDRGWKRSELAARLDCSYAHIYNIERGFRSASIEFLYRLAAVLGVPADQIIVRTDDKPHRPDSRQGSGAA